MAGDVMDDFRTALGDAGVLTGPDLVERYVVDHRDLLRGTTPAVLRPASTAEVQRIVQLAARLGFALVPQAGNTGYCGGATPDLSGRHLVVSLERMNRIREVDPLGHTLSGRCRRGAGGRAEGGVGARPHAVAEPRLGGQLPARRQRWDQRRRPFRAALRYDARSRARPGSGAAQRRNPRRHEAPAQEQHGLRPQAELHRLGGNARHRHRSRAEARPAAGAARHRLGATCRRRPAGGNAGADAARERRSRLLLRVYYRDLHRTGAEARGRIFKGGTRRRAAR